MHMMKVRFWEEIQKSERRKARMKFIKGMFKECLRNIGYPS